MPAKKKKSDAGARTTQAQRDEAIRRHMIDGVPAPVLAHELGVSPRIVDGWLAMWMRRVGSWQQRPLEQWAVDAGFELAPRGGAGDLHVVLQAGTALPVLPPGRDELIVFADRIRRIPTRRTSDVCDRYAALDAADRDRLAPALDLYLLASDLMGQVHELVQRAVAIVAGEFSASATPLVFAENIAENIGDELAPSARPSVARRQQQGREDGIPLGAQPASQGLREDHHDVLVSGREEGGALALPFVGADGTGELVGPVPNEHGEEAGQEHPVLVRRKRQHPTVSIARDGGR